MLIDTKIVKRLNFPFCKSNAIYLLVDYMERHSEIQFIQQRIPSLIEFMEWQYAHDCRLLDQDGLNDYLAYLYSKKSFNTAESVCSYVKSFCKYLVDEGFCGFVSFSSKPRKSSQTQDFYDSKTQDFSDDEEFCDSSNSDDTDSNDTEEQPKRHRGRPKKTTEKDCSADETEKPKRKRGRPRKDQQNKNNESEDQTNEENLNDNETKNADETHKNNHENSFNEQTDTAQESRDDDKTDDSESNENNKKRRGRPSKNPGTYPKLRRVTNYYDVLGITPNADLSEIKKAYHKLAKDMHPDLHEEDPYAEKRITSLNNIIAVLKDEVERMVYDVAMGFIEYDENIEKMTYKEIKWHNKRHYTVWI